MQATKPISVSSSSNKKSQKSQQINADVANKDKSIAQRVMDVTTTANSSSKDSTGHAQHQPVTILKQSSSNNSVENDHEVETITNRAASTKIDISPVNSNTSSTSNINGINLVEQLKKSLPINGQQHQHHKQQQQQQFAAERAGILSKSSSSLIVVSSIASSPPSAIGNLLPQQLDRYKSTMTNIETGHQTPTGASLCQLNRPAAASLLEPARIALDTKVPHPHQVTANNTTTSGTFRPAPFEDDEVSYYNDALTLEAKPACGDSINNNAPKLLLAASQMVGSNQQRSINNNNNNTAGESGFKQHQTNEGFKSQSDNKDVYQNDTNENQPPRQASYTDEHNYMTADYDDVYDVHYDNAPVVDKEATAAANHQQQSHSCQQKDTTLSSGYSRYQEISSPVPVLTSNSSPTQNSCSTHRAVSISTSPKAKSAPATPCNVTPTAFHQNSSHLSSLLNPNLANTLPPDIRKNISATCRMTDMLPSSINLAVIGGGRGGDEDGCNRMRFPQHLQLHRQQQQIQPTVAPTTVQPISFKYLDSLIMRGELALAEKNYISAIKLFSQCINLATENQNLSYLKKNFRIYSERAEAHFKLGNYNEAIDDSMAARELNPKWTQAYYLQGRAQFMIGQYADSLAVFSFGLTQDPTSEQLFDALIDAALSSSSIFRQEFEPKFNKLKSLQLDRRPFVVVAVLGQELLAKGHSEHAAIILESALKLSPPSTSMANNKNHEILQLPCGGGGGTTNNNQKKFKSSVLSTISLAYSLLRDYVKAIYYMNKELDIETELEDINGQCRVLSNLGYTYFKLRKFDKSLEAHRKQLNLAMRTHLYTQASQALNAIGHVHAAKNDNSNALTSHTRCLDILKQLDDDCYAQFKEMLSIGHIHLMLDDLKAADEKFDEARQLLEQKHVNKIISHEEFNNGSVMINFNLAHLALRRQSISKAVHYYESILKLTQSPISGATIKRTTYEMRACNGLGQAYRLLKNFVEARKWFEKQLKLAKTLKDQVGQSRALCNLGMICQQSGDHQGACRLFDENLKLVDNNLPLKAYAHSYMGSAYYLMNHPKESRDHYEISLNLFKGLEYFTAEQQTIDENMASIKRRTGHADMGNPTVLSTLNNLPTTVNQKKVMMAS